MKHKISIFTLLALSVGCGPHSQDSQLNQAWDRESDPRGSGYQGELNFADLTKDLNESSTLRLPWTDTYWPSVNQGLSHRWATLTRQPVSEVGLVDFFTTHLEESVKDHPSVYLSPAEKYDLIYRWRFGKQLTADTLEALQTTLTEKETTLSAATELKVKRQLIGEMNQALRQQGATLQSHFPLSWGGWEVWTNRTSNDAFQYLNQSGTGSNWAWEGLCHGWAPAALFSEAPKHAVKVKLDDQEILMTEGDIRGLLTYAWAHYAPSQDQYFIGRRCNIDVENEDSRGPLDASGRNTYGSIQLTAEGEKANFSFVKESSPAWLNRNAMIDRFGGRMRLYSIRIQDATERNAHLLELSSFNRQARRWYRNFYIAEQVGALRAMAENNDWTGITIPVSVDINGCGDVNPAVMHTTILQALKEERIGFVIDRTQSGQVWNQPVHKASVDVGKKILLETLIEGDPGLAQRFAPGTVSVLPVKVSLQWSYEPARPRMNYDVEYDQYYAQGGSDLEYILEFDRYDRLIGGEWGTFGRVQPSDQVPDFIFGYKKDSKPVDALTEGFDYTGIVGQIHACSLKPDAEGVERVGSQQLSFVTCDITKAAQ